MQIDLQVKNIVLIGFFDVSLFDKYFFIKNGIVNEDDILPISVFNGIGVIQLVSPKFQIVININQIIISDLRPKENDDLIHKIISTIISAGNIVGTTGMGINFHYHAADSSISANLLSKNLFYNDKVDLISKYFNSEDSRYGLYVSKNTKDARLKLDVKPSTVKDAITGKVIDLIAFVFNYHFDIINQNDTTFVLGLLADYTLYKNESEKIISLYQ